MALKIHNLLLQLRISESPPPTKLPTLDGFVCGSSNAGGSAKFAKPSASISPWKSGRFSETLLAVRFHATIGSAFTDSRSQQEMTWRHEDFGGDVRNRSARILPTTLANCFCSSVRCLFSINRISFFGTGSLELELLSRINILLISRDYGGRRNDGLLCHVRDAHVPTGDNRTKCAVARVTFELATGRRISHSIETVWA